MRSRRHQNTNGRPFSQHRDVDDDGTTTTCKSKCVRIGGTGSFETYNKFTTSIVGGLFGMPVTAYYFGESRDCRVEVSLGAPAGSKNDSDDDDAPAPSSSGPETNPAPQKPTGVDNGSDEGSPQPGVGGGQDDEDVPAPSSSGPGTDPAPQKPAGAGDDPEGGSPQPGAGEDQDDKDAPAASIDPFRPESNRAPGTRFRWLPSVLLFSASCAFLVGCW